MRYVIIVKSAPTSAAAHNAVKFTAEIAASGHELLMAFFYADGALTANSLAVPAQDELPLLKTWQGIIKTYGISAVVCIAAAIKRGVLDGSESRRYEQACANLAEGFRLGGLGELVEACSIADRSVTFQ